MIKKSFSKTGRHCRVTFKIPAGMASETAVVCGDFNNWDTRAKPMTRTPAGTFYATYSLPAGQTFRFRYLVDGSRWENDDQADDYQPNAFGTTDCVVSTCRAE